MDGIKIEVTGNIARVIEKPQTITSGTVGMTAEFTFDSAWDGLGKTAVFMACGEKRIVPVVDGEVVVPWEVLEKPKVWLSVGVYGTNTDGSLVIPTIWANVCVIRAGATAEGDPSADPTPPVWDQLNAEIEALKDAIENGGGGSGGNDGGGGTPGKDGKDGFSPIANVTETDSGAVITITDAEGTTEATVKNGRDGVDGIAGKDGKDGYTPVKGEDYYTEAEKDALVQEVLEQIPEGGGGNGTVTSVNGVLPDESGNVQIDVGVTVEEVLEAMPTISAINFYNFDNGSFTETVNGKIVTHDVTFDDEGKPTQIDDLVITWG